MIELTVVGANAPALVDACWAHLSRYRWRLDKGGYVIRRAKGQRIYLHQVVLPGDFYPALVRDHINRDKMDNRSANLRWVTPAENAQNTSAHGRNRTGFRGVRFDVQKGQYLARVQHKGRAVLRKWFDDPVEANAFLVAHRGSLLPASVEL